MLAITHVPSRRMNDCELTFAPRQPIDVDLAAAQHAAYCQLLRECGATVVTLSANRDWPDCAFVEDGAIVLDEIAAIASMGAASRRAELPELERALAPHRDIHRIHWPATIEGGDVLRVGRDLLVGLSRRTNRAGIQQLEKIATPRGYRVRPVAVCDCLHLKTACTALDPSRLIVNPDWIDTSQLADFELIRVPPSEPHAANVLPIADRVCLAAAHPRTADLLDRLGLVVLTADISEFAKAEAGLTCLSILVPPSEGLK